MKMLPGMALEKKIADTIGEIEQVESLYDASSVEYDLMMYSLNMRLEQLYNERNLLRNNEGKEIISLSLRGDSIGFGSISARLLSPVIHEIQAITDSIASALHHDMSVRGRIPIEVLEQSTLMVTDTFAGSFGVKMEADLGQIKIDDDPLITKTLNRLFDFFGSEIEPEALLTQVSELGPRTLRHYKKLIECIDDNRVSVSFDWHSNYYGKNVWSFDSSQIARLRSVLNLIEESESVEVELRGKLTAGSVRRNTFELEVSTESEYYLIKGKSKNGLFSENGIKLGDMVDATLIKTSSKILSAGTQKESWFLKEIVPIS